MAIRVGGGTLIEDYMHVNAMSDSGKYSTSGRDRQYRTHVQNAITIV